MPLRRKCHFKSIVECCLIRSKKIHKVWIQKEVLEVTDICNVHVNRILRHCLVAVASFSLLTM